MKDLGYKNLGFVNISILYLSLAFASMFAAVPINQKLGTKWTLVCSALTYALWIGMFLVPVNKYEKIKRNEDVSSLLYSDAVITILSLLSAMILGFGAAPLWVS